MELAQYTNQELLSLYIRTELRNKLHNKGNLESASRLLKKFLVDYLGGYPPTELNAKSFLSEHFNDRRLSTFGKHYYTLNGFMKWIGHDLNMKVRIPRTVAKYNEPATIMRLRDKIKTKRTHKGCLDRDLMLIDVKCGSGLRAAEMAKLRPCDIHETFIEVVCGKGGDDRKVYIDRGLGSKLLIFISNMKPYEPIFKLSARTISNKIRLWANKAGVKLSAHSLRHYYAEQLYHYSKDIQAVQVQLGHKSIATTERYLGLAPQQIQDAVGKMRPLSEEEMQEKIDTGLEAYPKTSGAEIDSALSRLAGEPAFSEVTSPGNRRLKKLGCKIDKVFGPRKS
ncbi:MAG TPA: tyrosine-type recombinase/integrase [Dehalococcoidia bacterium]|nr:tyrosine-type recombinase/integrase [Dehalococcoidia bacterium]